MLIKHDSIKINGIEKTYIYMELADDVEFAKEFLSKEGSEQFFNSLKSYITDKFEGKKDDIAVLIINGVLIGTISLGIFFNTQENQIEKNLQTREVVTSETTLGYQNSDDEVEASKRANEALLKKIEAEQKEVVKMMEETPAGASTPKVVNTNVSKPNTGTNTQVKPPVSAGIQVKVKTNGVVTTMNLEEYLIGVVAAEMPANYHLEALKAQAVAARTYTMKRVAQGKVLVNSTSDQVYKSPSQMKAMWGNTYNTNYNKLKKAVSATSSMVMKYNGQYIDAYYHAISNSKTEIPKYVWGSSAGYLQSVSSNWDKKVKGYEVSTSFSYATLTSKLGVSVGPNTSIIVLSRTTSGRVDKIQIASKTFSGVKVRTSLGLRSTDFTISLSGSGASITTKGYGHGVGMSQTGANEAAKEGYSYANILKHYYTNITLSKI